MTGDNETALREKVLSAMKSSSPLAVSGGGSKDFYGREIVGETLSIASHSGIVDYQPTELVITARAGTRIEEIKEILGEENQMLGFDPPVYSSRATLGGAVSAGLTGPSRPFRGSVQDYILGVKILSGRGEILNFGGKVIKNVAGFDVSRLMSGSLGCLGVLLEISLKVLPKPESESTLIFDDPESSKGIERMTSLAGLPYPVTAAAWIAGETRIRLSGSQSGVTAAQREIGGDSVDCEIWQSLRDSTHSFFNNDSLQIRATVPSATAPLSTDSNQLLDWAGGCRWICSEQWDNSFNEAVALAGGHCTLYKNGDRTREVFAIPDAPVFELHKNLKRTFDPMGILNPGRMYRQL